MSAPNPEHLIDQAERLIALPQAGAPRQADIRRAISAAYYASFHATLIASSDQLVGVTLRATPEYALAYRSVDHRSLRSLCDEIVKPSPPARHAPYWPVGGFSGDLVRYAAAISDLQENRHAADYDPSVRFKLSDAQVAIKTARLAMWRLTTVPASQFRTFVALLLFPPRR